jgi:aspartyl/asparaginyl-tRNA synthetase
VSDSTADHSTHLRTHMCGELRSANVGERVSVCGWVAARREHSQHLSFVDLRDHTGRVQCVVDGSVDVRSEYVLRVTGEVRAREDATINPNLATGEIELKDCSVECCRWPSRRRSRSMTAPRPTRPSGCDIATSTCDATRCSATSEPARP